MARISRPKRTTCTRGSNQKFAPARVLAVDVDGTLIKDGRVNLDVTEMIRAKKADGFEIIIWSARGTMHAYKAAQLAEVVEFADVITGKPGYILDDKGWTWVDYTRVVVL